MSVSEQAENRVNIGPTSAGTDTPLTQRRSRRVRGKLLAKQMLKLAKGTVYFVRAGDKIKIGFSTDAKTRINSLQTSNPERLELLGVIDGPESHERSLHHRFRHLHVLGEWFRAEADLLDYIRVATGQPEPARPRVSRPKIAMTQEMRDLMALRVKYGAQSDIGSRCSILIGQFGNMQLADESHRPVLAGLMQRQAESLKELLAPS